MKNALNNQVGMLGNMFLRFMVKLGSWMILPEACPGTFVSLKGACGKTTTPGMYAQQSKKGVKNVDGGATMK